jgi:hypothetical protein
MQKHFIFLLGLVLSGLLSGCSTEQMRAIGESRCLDLPGAQLGDRLDCTTRNKRVFDEFEKTKTSEPASSKKVAPEADPLCYKNPRAGEKACATTETTGK